MPPPIRQPGLIAPWLSTTPRPDDAICEKRNPSETDAALMRLLRIAEQESGNFHATPENSAEGPLTQCTPELPLPTTRLELKEEIANGDTSPHPAETYVASEADVAISAEHESGNSYAAPECADPKIRGGFGREGVSDGTNEWDCCLVPTIPCRTMKSRVSRRQTSWSAIGYGPSA